MIVATCLKCLTTVIFVDVKFFELGMYRCSKKGCRGKLQIRFQYTKLPKWKKDNREFITIAEKAKQR